MSFSISFDEDLSVELVVTIPNNSDIPTYPEMLIKKYCNDGDVVITNLNTGQIFKLTDLKNEELIYINNDNETITSDIANSNPEDKFNNQFLYFIRGTNTLKTDGNCKLRFRYRERFLPHGGGD